MDCICDMQINYKMVSNAHVRMYSVYQTVQHSRPQRPRSFWSAPRIATSGRVQYRKSAIHGLPVTLCMLRVRSDKSDWFWSQSIVFTKPFKTGISLDQARGSSQRSRFLVLIKRSAPSGDENDHPVAKMSKLSQD